MIQIRIATESDASGYAHLINKSWKDTYGDYISLEHIDSEFNIEQLIFNFKDYIRCKDFELYVIDYDGKIVGIIELGKYEDQYKENMSGIGEIRSLHIYKEYQNHGLGTMALTFGIHRLSELGYQTCCIWVKKQNTNAISFYEKNGFIKTKYDCCDTVDGAPSFVMERKI